MNKERFMKNGVFSLEYDKETLKDMVLELQQENKQLKKQKDDVVEYIKTTTYSDITGLEKHNITEFWFIKDLLRMLGEKDAEN